MAYIQSITTTTNYATVDPTFKAARLTFRPVEMEGAYRLQQRSGVIAAATAAGLQYSFRYWGTGTCVIQSVRIGLNVIAAYTQGNIAYRMFPVRNMTTPDTTGGTLAIYGFNNRLRTQMITSQVQAYITTTANITAAAGVSDAQAVGSAIFNLPAAITGQPMQDLFTYNPLYGMPLTLTLNEGFRINSQTAYAATGTSNLVVVVEWTEYPAISTSFF